jgi:hypothetical protein
MVGELLCRFAGNTTRTWAGMACGKSVLTVAMTEVVAPNPRLISLGSKVKRVTTPYIKVAIVVSPALTVTTTGALLEPDTASGTSVYSPGARLKLLGTL